MQTVYVCLSLFLSVYLSIFCPFACLCVCVSVYHDYDSLFISTLTSCSVKEEFNCLIFKLVKLSLPAITSTVYTTGLYHSSPVQGDPSTLRSIKKLLQLLEI